MTSSRTWGSADADRGASPPGALLIRQTQVIVRRALIPCGGRDTRMLALTGGAAKELIPVAGVPAVEWVARECAASGIDELLVIIAPGKESIRDHLSPIAGQGGLPSRIEFVVQPNARGLADAMRLGRDFAAGESLLAGDRLVGRRMLGRFLDLGLPEGYAEAERLLGAQRETGAVGSRSVGPLPVA